MEEIVEFLLAFCAVLIMVIVVLVLGVAVLGSLQDSRVAVAGMMVCPKCKGRATKLVSLTTGVITCQQCGHQWTK